MTVALYDTLAVIGQTEAFKERVRVAMLASAVNVYGEPVVKTGSITGTTVITMADTSSIVPGMVASGPGVPAGAIVLSLVANTSVTLNVPTTLTIANASFSFAAANHALRAAFATKVLLDSGYDLTTAAFMVLTVVNALVNFNAASTPEYGLADTDINNAVAACWNAMAGA